MMNKYLLKKQNFFNDFIEITFKKIINYLKILQKHIFKY